MKSIIFAASGVKPNGVINKLKKYFNFFCKSKIPSVKTIRPITFFGKPAEVEVWDILSKKIIK